MSNATTPTNAGRRPAETGHRHASSSSPTRRRRRAVSSPDSDAIESGMGPTNAIGGRKIPLNSTHATAQRRHRISGDKNTKISPMSILLVFIVAALVFVVGCLYAVTFHISFSTPNEQGTFATATYHYQHNQQRRRTSDQHPQMASEIKTRKNNQHDAVQDVHDSTQDAPPMLPDTSDMQPISNPIGGNRSRIPAHPIVIRVDAMTLSISNGPRSMMSPATPSSLRFESSMAEHDDDTIGEGGDSGDAEQETHTIHAWSSPDPHATLPDGKIDVLQRQAAWEQQCDAMPPWQRTVRPTCNVVHELELSSTSDEADMKLISKGGYYRMAWKLKPKSSYLDIEEAGEGRRAYLVKKFNSIPELLPPKQKQNNCTETGNSTLSSLRCANSTGGRLTTDTDGAVDGIDDADYGHSMVLKMLRIDREYNEETFRYNQVDIMAMDRFTASPFVIDAYGFCGMSVMTEVAGGSGRELIKRTDIEPRKRLRIARNLAMGLSQIHGDREGKNASLVHNDLNLENLVLVKTSTIKFNDFNIAMMGRYNPKTNEPCGHPVLFESPLWRSPEEIRDDGSYVNEKIDVYAFGNILFQILTKHQPWTWLELEKPTIEEIARKKMRGELPRVPEKYAESDNMATQALYIATMMCYAYDPKKRPSIWRLANSLAKAHREFSLFKKGKRKDLTFDELQVIFGL